MNNRMANTRRPVPTLRQGRREGLAGCIGIILWAIFVLAFWGTIIFVAWHFISRYW